MKVIQIIDSLDAGGAERMAIQIANELQAAGHESHLCTTRKEGLLKETISDAVGYIFIEKKGRLGLKAMTKLKTYVVKNNIEIIHAHSTSFFTATIIKWWLPQLKLVWHDHYGNAEEVEKRSSKIIKKCSRFFNGIISVNEKLHDWSIKQLRPSKVVYFRNFVSVTVKQDLLKSLPGIDGKRIVHLANLRPQKDHFTLLNAFKLIAQKESEWKLLLVGMDFQDDYSIAVKKMISDFQLEESVFLLGSREDTTAILNASNMAVLSSKSEGLPVALLEYGMAGIPVVVTDVGACREVVSIHGKIVPSQDAILLSQALQEIIQHPVDAKIKAQSFQEHVMTTFGASTYIKKLEHFYSTI